jgi:DegV family protein with EDD domain
MIHVVTDSTSDITQAEAARLGIRVVPLTVRFGEEQFLDGVDLDSAAFYAKLRTTTVHPTTSQPTPEQFADVYRALLKSPGDEVVSMHISAKLSGTLQSANVAAGDVDPERIHLVDTESASGGQQLLLLAALEDISEGHDARWVAKRATQRRAKVTISVLLDTLTYLQRGGRIGRAQAMVGALLSVKPIITVVDGEVAPQARVRNRNQGIEKIIELLRERMPLRGLAAFHCGAPELLDPLCERLAGVAPSIAIVRGQVGPVIGAYTGPGGIGIASLGAD